MRMEEIPITVIEQPSEDAALDLEVMEPSESAPAIWDVLLIGATTVAVAFVIAPGLARWLIRLMEQAGVEAVSFPLPVLFLLTIQEGLTVIGIGLVALLGRRLKPKSLGLLHLGGWWILAWLGLGVAIIPFRLAVGVLVYLATGGSLQDFMAGSESDFVVIGYPLLGGIPVIFLVGVIAPIVEEMVFRGVLYTWLRKHGGVIVATVISSVLFGLVHANVAQGVAAFIMALTLALAYEHTRSLWVPIAMHIANNTLVFSFAFFVLALQQVLGQIAR